MEKKKKKSGILHMKVNKNSKACLYLIIPIGGRRTRILKGKINRICIQVQDRVEKGTKSISRSYIASYGNGYVLKECNNIIVKQLRLLLRINT